ARWAVEGDSAESPRAIARCPRGHARLVSRREPPRRGGSPPHGGALPGSRAAFSGGHRLRLRWRRLVRRAGERAAARPRALDIAALAQPRLGPERRALLRD